MSSDFNLNINKTEPPKPKETPQPRLEETKPPSLDEPSSPPPTIFCPELTPTPTSEIFPEQVPVSGDFFMTEVSTAGFGFEDARVRHDNFLLTNENQLYDLIDKYNSNKASLSDEDRQYYDAFLDKFYDSSKVFNFNENLDAKKAYLALSKLDKYEYDTTRFEKYDAPRINENTETLGQYSNDFNSFLKLINNDSSFKASLDNFYKQIYGGQESSYVCLLSDDKEKVQVFAQQMLENEIDKYDDKLEDLYYESDFRNVTYTIDTGQWSLQVLIKGDVDGQDKYLPKELVILHELYHVKQMEPGTPENHDGRYYELGATIDSIVKSDEIHKKINDMPLDAKVEYSRYYITRDGTKVNIGTLANEFREIMIDNDFENWEQVFMSPEGKALIEKYF